MPTELRLLTGDGVSLAGTAFGAHTAARVLLIATATGVRRQFYFPLADFLAQRGIAVLVWDWRGVGDSRPRSLRGYRASMTEWATRDLPAAIDHAAERWPDASLHALGHSFGGQAFGLAANAERLRSLVTVAAQSGYFGHWEPPARYRYAVLWHVLMPAVTHLTGYFPSRRLGLGEDLPAGVALEWARWCRSPNYLGDFSGHARLTTPILALSFSDDVFAPLPAVEWLHARYGAREIVRRHLTPHDLGVDRVGHFGFFRGGDATAPLWREVADWIERH